MDFAIGNLDKRRNAATQIQKRMQFDRCLVSTESGPGKKRKTQIDGRRIEGINGLIQFDSEIVVGVQVSGRTNQDLSKIGIDAPISVFVGFG